MRMSYMVGYGSRWASSLPLLDQHAAHIACKEATPYFSSAAANPNQLTVTGAPAADDSYADDHVRVDATKSEPTTYANAPLLGLLGLFQTPLFAHSLTTFNPS